MGSGLRMETDSTRQSDRWPWQLTLLVPIIVQSRETAPEATSSQLRTNSRSSVTPLEQQVGSEPSMPAVAVRSRICGRARSENVSRSTSPTGARGVWSTTRRRPRGSASASISIASEAITCPSSSSMPYPRARSTKRTPNSSVTSKVPSGHRHGPGRARRDSRSTNGYSLRLVSFIWFRSAWARKSTCVFSASHHLSLAPDA